MNDSSNNKPIVFLSYSHEDEIWKDLLHPHLGVLQQEGLIELWDDRMIGAGKDWYPEIVNAMRRAKMAVCLISAHYLSSVFVNNTEIPFFLERRKSDEMLLLPILVSPCVWKAVSWLEPIQMLPKNTKPLASIRERAPKQQWLSDIAEEVHKMMSGFITTGKHAGDSRGSNGEPMQ